MNRRIPNLEGQETRELVKSAFGLARSLGINRLVVQADEISDMRLVDKLRGEERVIWVAGERKQIPVSDPSKDVVVAMPDAALNRLGQLNLALFLAVLNGHLEPEERVLGLSGVTGSQRLDTLVIAKPMRDYPWLRRHKSDMTVTRHLARLLEIALHFAGEGREGSTIGAIFVLGDRSNLSPHLRQLILNPLKGHTRRCGASTTPISWRRFANWRRWTERLSSIAVASWTLRGRI